MVEEGRQPFFCAEHIHALYGTGFALTDVSFEAEAGALTALLGANGSGKTTLLRAICQQMKHEGRCFLTAAQAGREPFFRQGSAGCAGSELSGTGRGSGRAAVSGESSGCGAICRVPLEELSLRSLARAVSYLPQRGGIFMRISVLDMVLMGFHPVLGLLERPDRAKRRQAQAALEAVGLAGMEGRDYQSLSEGQKRLVLLARLSVEDARLLVLDEPDGALDFPNRYGMIKKIAGLVRGQKRAAILSLHDPMLALEFCSQIILLKDGRVTGIINPMRDRICEMEEALREIYGPLTLAVCSGKDGRKRLVLLVEEEGVL